MQAPIDRLTAAGRQLVEIHDWLREELERLRSDPHPSIDSLAAHCLAFCGAVTRHHTAEDRGPFAALAEQVPALRPVIEELTRDHELVAELLIKIQDLKTPEALHRELDGLAALLESHFTYEERKLAAALTELAPTAALW